MPEETPKYESVEGTVLEAALQTMQPLAHPYTVKLDRGQRGTYGWEITVRGENYDKVLEDLEAIDRLLVANFAAPKES